jgi:hypothetical protein
VDRTRRWHPWTISQGGYPARGSLVDRSLSASLHIVGYRDACIGISSLCVHEAIAWLSSSLFQWKPLTPYVLHFFPYPLSVSVDSNFLIGYRNLVDWRANHDLSI